jgi:hypothetical protein
MYFTGHPLSSERVSKGSHSANQSGAGGISQYLAALQQGAAGQIAQICAQKRSIAQKLGEKMMVGRWAGKQLPAIAVVIWWQTWQIHAKSD